MRRFLTASALVVTAAVTGHSLAAAMQSAPPAQADVTNAIESAKALKASGKAAEAVDQMAAVLKKYPASLEATTFQVDTLIELNRFDEALKTYDAHATASKKPHAATLARIGRADLVRTARSKNDQPLVMAQALERLGRQGDADAVTALRRQMGATTAISPESLAPTVALARLKDPAGETRLGEMLRSSRSTDLAQVIQAIGQARLRSQAVRVIPLLGDSDIHVRNAAAVTLGLLQDRQAVAPLQNAFKNDEAGAVKLFAAVSLKQLGDSTADTFLEDRLKGQIADLQVIAAGAWQFAKARSPAWEKAVRALLGSSNELHRLKAAELLACCDRAAARDVLTSALGSPNPLLRAAAAKALEDQPGLADLSLARRMLGDSALGVRLHGAGLAWALAR